MSSTKAPLLLITLSKISLSEEKQVNIEASNSNLMPCNPKGSAISFSPSRHHSLGKTFNTFLLFPKTTVLTSSKTLSLSNSDTFPLAPPTETDALLLKSSSLLPDIFVTTDSIFALYFSSTFSNNSIILFVKILSSLILPLLKPRVGISSKNCILYRSLFFSFKTPKILMV